MYEQKYRISHLWLLFSDKFLVRTAYSFFRCRILYLLFYDDGDPGRGDFKMTRYENELHIKNT